MKKPDYLPQDYDRIKIVDSLSELFASYVEPHENVVLYPRSGLQGDFNALARQLDVAVDQEKSLKQVKTLREKICGRGAQDALDTIIADMEVIQNDRLPDGRRSFRAPLLRIIPEKYGLGDAFDFHGDIGLWRLMCCYNDPVTEGLRNDQAEEAMLSRLKKLLPEYVRDKVTYYKPLPGAKPFRFRAGDMWLHSGSDRDTPPFIHRAEKINKTDPVRLLVVANRPKSVIF